MASSSWRGPERVLKLPRRFFDDHETRALDTPVAVRKNKVYVWVDTEDPAFSELVDDARYYTDPLGPDDCPTTVRAAQRLLDAIPQSALLPS